MTGTRVEITGMDGSKVISIEVARHRKLKDGCKHIRVEVDRSLSTLTCLDCGREVNPVEYVAYLAEEWKRIEYMMKQYKDLEANHRERTRTKCMHCGKMTPVSKR